MNLYTQIYLPGLISNTRKPWSGPLRDVIYDDAAMYHWDEIARKHGLDPDVEDFDLGEHVELLTLEDVSDLADDPNVEVVERQTAAELLAARRVLGIRQDTLAERVGVRRDTVTKWETGKMPIPYRVPEELRTVAAERIVEIRDYFGLQAPPVVTNL